jgi:hypothetical protein
MPRTIRLGLYLVLAALAGCGKSTSSISGEVTYNGVPVESGYMTFNPVGKGRAFAARIANGSYSAAEAQPGKFKAVASGSRKIDHYSSSAEAYANASPNAGHVAEAADYIASDADGNAKEIEISSGAHQLDLAITGPPMPK